MEIDALIATALVSEFGPIAKGMGRGGRRHEDYRLQVSRVGRYVVAIVQLGIGPTRARRAIKWAIDQLAPKRVWMVGIAGGLDPALPLGYVVIPQRLIDERGDEVSIISNDSLFQPTSTATMLQVDRVILTSQEKARLHQHSGAVAVDMESLAVARACRESNIPMQVVRFISDTAHDSMPPEIVGLVNEEGNPQFLTALKRILKRPRLLTELLAIERSNKVVTAAMTKWARDFRDRIICLDEESR
jgi:nucleoside phosphorylase